MGITVEIEPGTADPGVMDMLVTLTDEQQDGYDHPRESRDQIAKRLRQPGATFTGENHLVVARDGGEAVGVCWCVLFDPGTGLEGEIAELFVRPEWRGRGVATGLLGAARELFVQRAVTFACVWTRDDNPAALAAYRAAGFAPTEQTVLTWLPLAGR
jgi:GNAT superfamily N-acetyltransferase